MASALCTSMLPTVPQGTSESLRVGRSRRSSVSLGCFLLKSLKNERLSVASLAQGLSRGAAKLRCSKRMLVSTHAFSAAYPSGDYESASSAATEHLEGGSSGNVSGSHGSGAYSNGAAASTTNEAGAAAVTRSQSEQQQLLQQQDSRLENVESWFERRIFNCRFLTIFAVCGSLAGSTLCFLKGCIYVGLSFQAFVVSCLRMSGTGKVILFLVEALDIYLMGTVMLIFGMGLHELFIKPLDIPSSGSQQEYDNSFAPSSLFGLFPLRQRPKWLEIHSLEEMKTKLGHVIVMILLVGMFEKSKKVIISSALDLFLFSSSVCAAAGCLFLLSKLHESH